MTTIVTRAGKGSPLTNTEMDTNLTNLNTNKYESGSNASFGTLTSTGNATLGDAEATDTHAIKDATTLLANSASAALTVTQTGSGNAFVVEDSTSPDSTPFLIDANGFALLGHTSSIADVFGEVKLQVRRTDENLASFSNYANDANAGIVYFNKARGGSITAPTVLSSGDTVSSLLFSGYDGAAFKNAAEIKVQIDGTPGTNDMPGRLTFSTTADGASSPTERMRIDSAGNVGIGGAANPYDKLLITGMLPSGSSVSRAVEVVATIPSSSTGQGAGFLTNLSTQDVAFSLTNVQHFVATQGTITGGSRTTPTTQIGYEATSSLTGATNNFGFYSAIASGTGRWNFYAAGTADNYFAGRVGLSATPNSLARATIGNITGGTVAFGAYLDSVVQSDVTAVGRGLVTNIGTAGTTTAIQHVYLGQGTFSGAVTNQYGVYIESNLTGATNNYAFHSNIAAGTGRWNFYAAGTAANYFGGLVDISGASAGQIKFPATQNASADANTLDDYEEGDWTPAISFGGGTTGITYTSQSGKYTKVGRKVTVSCLIVLSAKGSSSGAMLVTGLPFSSGSGLNDPASVRVNSVTSGVGDTHLQGLILTGSSTARVEKIASGSFTQLTDADITATSAIQISGTYNV